MKKKPRRQVPKDTVPRHCSTSSHPPPRGTHSNITPAQLYFLRFTRGRFIVDEAENLRRRQIRFDMNKLAHVASESVDAARCAHIRKYADGMFNKAFLMTMDDGQEVVAKVPNPNAGIPHFTTASEVATINFARKVLDTPAPQVYAWNSHAKSHAVGAEFIVIEKVKGVPLSKVWEGMTMPQRFQVLLAMIQLHKRWLAGSFSHYGSLHYSQDVQSPPGGHYVKDGEVVKDSEFTIGPSTGRDWVDGGRSALAIDRGPWTSLVQYLQAVSTRETKAIRSLQEKKLDALSSYLQILDTLIPKDLAITNPYLWHNDLHGDNLYVDPEDYGKVTGIIDWQSCHVSPLFNHNTDPAFIDWDDLKPESLSLVPRPKFSELSPEEKVTAERHYTYYNTFLGWRNLMRVHNPNLYSVIEFRKTSAYGLIFLAHRIFEYGENHFDHF
ncbi:hypothetical protein M011DRAFT_495809 [Sporormia fimetaria CBS 119925]|uniref:Altered inheritance of mitochondria protein 9, mitochondrial n=1 Tax=Sporormia fimetaria CBS 119925 TaxID=1340428 RepID=A0A6A6V6X1_9PLEO|nr:hypothetical protein M011DRAFT_495809 [Sporormia fimetaria CBS 119925]